MNGMIENGSTLPAETRLVGNETSAANSPGPNTRIVASGGS